MDRLIRILLVEDSPSDADVLQESLRRAKAGRFHFTWVQRLQEALARLRTEPFDVLLLDLSLPDSTGADTFRQARSIAPQVPIVVLTGTYDEHTGLAALREGVQDYLIKGQDDGRQIARAIRYAVERSRAEQALRDSEQRLQMALEVGRSFAFEWDPVTDRVLRSESCSGVLGVCGEEIQHDTGQRYFQRVHADDRERFLATLRALKPGADSYRIQYRVIRGDGSIAVLEEIARGFFGADGKLCRLLGTTTDITERKRAEEALREREQRFQLMADAVPYGAWFTDAAGYCTYVSPSFLELVGMSMEQVQRFGWLHLLPPEDVEPTKAHWIRCVQTGENFEREHRFRTKDNGWRNVLAIGRPIRDERGQIISWVGLNLDITDRKSAEEALRESESRYRRLMQSIPIPLGVVNRNGESVYFNDRFTQVFGYTQADLPTLEAWWQRAYPGAAYRRRVMENWQAKMRRSEETRTETEPEELNVTCKDGSVRVVVISNLAIEDCILATFIDITERKAAEEGLKQAKAVAESANAAKDQFLAALSHELRTPLTPVLMLSQLYGGDSSLPEEARMDMETIRQNITLEARLIDDLLDLTRIARGKIHLQLEQVDVHALLREALRTCSDENFLHKKLRVSCDLAAGQSQVYADPVRLEQVFWNLIKNAIKFTPAAGQITIRTENAGDRIRVLVSDTGVGIEPDKLGSIFNAFEQGGDQRTRTFGGLGLGLAISKGIVDLHAGEIRAVSEGVGKGTTMIVELPLAVEALRPEPAVGTGAPQCNVQTAPAARRRILLVEDHGPTGFVMRRLMTKWGYDVELVTSVQAAKEVAARQSFDLVISDLGLPDGNGHELMAYLRQQHDLRGIALSGYGMEGDVEKSLAAGFVEHLTKPVDFDQFRKSIAAALDARGDSPLPRA